MYLGCQNNVFRCDKDNGQVLSQNFSKILVQTPSKLQTKEILGTSKVSNRC